MNISMATIADIFAWTVRMFFQLDMIVVGMAAAILLHFVLQFRIARARRLQIRELEEDMEDLRAVDSAIRSALEDTKRKVAEVAFAIAQKSDAQERRMAGELQILESLVRGLASNMEQNAEQALLPRLAGPNAAEQPEVAMLEIIRCALEGNRVDLYLQPVVSLPQRKLRFYEALSRLRSEDGSIIMPAQYIRIAAPAGLMSVVDNLLLFRCVQVVRRLTQRHRDVGVFCNISGHTLTDTEFFPQFLDFMHHHRDLAGQIIFEFSQDCVLAASAPEEANLRYLANLGFRLSMDQVTKLDLDFAKLKRLGFQFLKVRATTLISGMKDAGAAVAAEDLKNLLSRNGISLIAERVEDEKTVVQLLDYNVDFGQGYLFGEPRAIREIAEANDPRAAPIPPTAKVLPEGLARRLAG
ncbi:MAG TPA: EAL domain-containing protein [Micropepsaceae bacterium]|nr:EAL domain-containing protein [Micropepsaceae bacterium]